MCSSPPSLLLFLEKIKIAKKGYYASYCEAVVQFFKTSVAKCLIFLK